VREVRLPSITSLPWDAFYLAEIGAYHVQLFKRAAGSYRPATCQALQAAANVSAADYVLACSVSGTMFAHRQLAGLSFGEWSISRGI